MLAAAVCTATITLGVPASAQPFEDEEREGPRSVLGARASLDRGELGAGGWSIVTDMPDRLVLVAGAARVRVVADAVLEGATDGGPGRGSLVAALADTPGLEMARYVTRPTGVFAVFDTTATRGAPTSQVPPDSMADIYRAQPDSGRTLTGEGEAKVVLGTPSTVERTYVVTRGAGNLVVEVQAPLGTDRGRASLDAADALVLTLAPAGGRIDDNLSPLGYARR